MSPPPKKKTRKKNREKREHFDEKTGTDKALPRKPTTCRRYPGPALCTESGIQTPSRGAIPGASLPEKLKLWSQPAGRNRAHEPVRKPRRKSSPSQEHPEVGRRLAVARPPVLGRYGRDVVCVTAAGLGRRPDRRGCSGLACGGDGARGVDVAGPDAGVAATGRQP